MVKDYHFASLTKKITPQLFNMNGSYGTYYIKIKPNTAAASLKWIQKTYQQFYPMTLMLMCLKTMKTGNNMRC